MCNIIEWSLHAVKKTLFNENIETIATKISPIYLPDKHLKQILHWILSQIMSSRHFSVICFLF